MTVVCPTRTPGTSVMASRAPEGRAPTIRPMSRDRGRPDCCARFNPPATARAPIHSTIRPARREASFFDFVLTLRWNTHGASLAPEERVRASMQRRTFLRTTAGAAVTGLAGFRPAKAADAQIEINPGAPGPVISPHLYGHFIEHLG